MIERTLADEKADRRAAEAKARWKPDEGMELLAKWRDSGDPRYDALSAQSKTQLGYYLNDRKLAKGAKK